MAAQFIESLAFFAGSGVFCFVDPLESYLTCIIVFGWRLTLKPWADFNKNGAHLSTFWHVDLLSFLLFRSHHFGAPHFCSFHYPFSGLLFSILEQAASTANPRAASVMYIQPSAVTERLLIRSGQLGIFLMLVISKSGGPANHDFKETKCSQLGKFGENEADLCNKHNSRNN